MKVFLIAGARPNFMKIAPIYRASVEHNDIECKIVHTGQHYDHEMSQAFFDELEIPVPAYHLETGSGSQAVQTAKIMVAFEDVCGKEKPDLVMVVGDVNSTLACSIVAKKLCIKVAHVEAGLRSFDLAMPEEINRMVTDAITDYFFVTEESGLQNLIREGKSKDSVHYVGHVMIDNLLHQLEKLDIDDGMGFRTYNLKQEHENYAFLTLHRPSNVDNKETFDGIAVALNAIAEKRPIFFPVHPRTKKMIHELNINLSKNIILLPPLSFKESLFIWKDAEVVITDSGGLQEETTALGKPCVTIRQNTERPITLEIGSNVLAGTKTTNILNAYAASIEKARRAMVPPLWDGKASERIWSILEIPKC
ncbi:MAG: UDP-N-acetylglucosamine 2-epimerase (non-hydrolyzing) [Syntrophorhabdaceae bacterium]|nr:UDP-N-acetylglucosamine 2-epimerase (non-hydrolyzing) [Syntrophorhabdaceae bacterium]MDD4197277.1 UDP-N-acetylglucosamine 2-epimerase (non-hydrolyzing) [Syntrophorhabdaceae bacterium]